mmetsp:Transcript_14557/g.25913  ORF Transcript_14557/g.25913 Transcript_14557/m.25913 type:complete len:243 (+) Transcript_14557:10900-11628(+)
MSSQHARLCGVAKLRGCGPETWHTDRGVGQRRLHVLTHEVEGDCTPWCWVGHELHPHEQIHGVGVESLSERAADEARSGGGVACPPWVRLGADGPRDVAVVEQTGLDEEHLAAQRSPSGPHGEVGHDLIGDVGLGHIEGVHDPPSQRGDVRVLFPGLEVRPQPDDGLQHRSEQVQGGDKVQIDRQLGGLVGNETGAVEVLCKSLMHASGIEWQAGRCCDGIRMVAPGNATGHVHGQFGDPEL